ncbi:prepilin-type N-terminal cleavage/methylation domain-containing protein [Geoalkalibacter ferrihydriticus]|uniref:Prepilin-type N-terminal cleavage/methylation domain-containing protein n=2 Tax=Geoalkalibacter ferrihydriticus TaxID=392333 RepID=A0A0C2HW02_9BACT|nr:prepilin-type N-terminal cleavage/methylation domain-containing protein [Geoalkalibacter ferrihydriticus]KIH76927.1 hypothetical protein GFER_07515 [Geoalkalibacter ferrihydriticus DSM 17813]SDL44094.1 prepilin-type N-terminal cleavage/methylation domain-containing protein [Geoalkalibacter ferrihydriticus]
MRQILHFRSQRGFTLIELLIVSALLGVVMVAVFGLVQTSQRHAHTTEEVVEVQQNLRVALERMSRDLRLAGLGVADEDIFVSAPASLRCVDLNDNGDCLDPNEFDALIFRTLSAPGVIARISDDLSTTGTEETLNLASEGMVRLFHAQDYLATPVYARIFRPASRIQPLDRVFQVTASDPEARTLTLSGFLTPVTLRPGDLVVRVEVPAGVDPNTNPPEHPNLVRYRLVKAASADEAQFLLVRVPTGVNPNDADAFEILASKITEVTFDYLNDSDGDIRAIRITLTGATDATRTGTAGYVASGQDNNIRTRSLTTVVQLRNR